ncbi:hypothetical protein AVEN_151496-1 [Araneus ventricosus]|uniref:Uncharacterized protein n=1 Tax=Araneus ventricosus TaxID=182803 RepID=A0A4Y2HXW0_ARAVE|nr:hypothetical protein AVEN_151496-1 [Araneus ventricosus]
MLNCCTGWVILPPAGVERKFGGRECRLRCCPRYLTTIENYEVSPKIVLGLLQNGRSQEQICEVRERDQKTQLWRHRSAYVERQETKEKEKRQS